MMRILSSDLLIADVITPIEGNPALARLVEKYAMQPGGKIALDKAQFEAFSASLIGFPVTIVPGGSSANMLVTLRKLLGDKVSVDFIGVAGEGLSSLMIRASLEEAGIRLHPARLDPSVLAKTAMSYVVVLPDGQRTIATYPGNAGELLTPAMVTDALVGSCDVVHVQGSLWAKINPAFADALVEKCFAHKKQFWLSLPTHGISHAGKAGMVDLIKKANLMLGNEDELTRILGDNALEKLQAQCGQTQVAFITRSSKGAVAVRQSGVESCEPVAIAPSQIKNTLGAGDTAFAGFVAGFLCKLPDKTALEIAVTLAAEKLKINAARLPDPKSALPKILMDYLLDSSIR